MCCYRGRLFLIIAFKTLTFYKVSCSDKLEVWWDLYWWYYCKCSSESDREM